MSLTQTQICQIIKLIQEITERGNNVEIIPARDGYVIREVKNTIRGRV